MELLFWIILFTALGGVLSALAAGAFLLLPLRWRARVLPSLISFATGALLGAAFLGLLPAALSAPHISYANIATTILLGLLLFFVLEKFVLWRHCHAEGCETHAPDARRRTAVGHLVLIGDGIHNFVDGILIASAFLTDVHLGMVTGLAIAAHEIPQELGDFAVLLHAGFTRRKAFAYNLLTSGTMILGGVLAYFFLSLAGQITPYVVAIAAASFIYIAVADLIPDLHKRVEASATMQQIVLLLAGVGVIVLAERLFD
jgi:zinc and cadmium transporter